MGEVTVKIPLVTWRNGKPRFIPGPRHRAMGLKGEDLKHPDGRWYSFEEARAWSEARQAEIAAARPRRKSPAPARGTIAELFEAWFREPRMNGEDLVEGRKRRRALKPNTVRYYRDGARLIERFDGGAIWTAPLTITPRTVSGVLDRIERRHGLAQTRCVRATLSAAYGFARRSGRATFNPVAAIEETLPTLEPRIRYGSIEEMKALVAAADAIGRPDVGDAIVLGLWTGQRQNDRLDLAGGQVGDDGIVFRQSKKHGQPLLIPEAPELAARLKAARQRRHDWRVNYPNVILDEVARRPFAPHWYRKVFRKVRDAAVAGGENRAPMPSLADFRDQDLRDTAVTWLALAENNEIGIASITGHSLASIKTILKHYLGLHPELARSAIGKLVTWYDQQGESK